MSIYELKPKFQNLLRPLVKRLYNAGITANQVTLVACVLSILLGALLIKFGDVSALFFFAACLDVFTYGFKCYRRHASPRI